MGIPMTQFLIPRCVASFVLLVAGCGLVDGLSDTPDLRVAEDVSFVLHEGQTARLRSTPLSLTFLQRTNEGRCPTGVVCVFEGAVEVTFAFSIPPSAPDTFLVSGFPPGIGHATLALRADGYTVAIERVDPYPVHERQDREPVTATVRITRDP